MSDSLYGRGLTGLLKKGWHEIPSVMASSVLGIIGVGIIIYDIYAYQKKGEFTNKYKVDYIVVRPDDPRVNEKARSYPW